jgi:hypothetical protein
MKMLTTILTGVIILSEIITSARAAETDAHVPVTTTASFPPVRPTIDQLPSRFLAEPRALQPSNNYTAWDRNWAISLAPLFASQALDAASSYGMRELNPLLASPNGSFGTKATGIKFGVIGTLACAEYFLVRKYPRSAKIFTIVNWTTTGATTGLVVHNYRLH